MKKPVVTICSSANFYRKAVELQIFLEKAGYQTIIPSTAEKMKKTGDYDVSHYRTWLTNSDDYHKKTRLMQTHFKEIENGDVVLIINEEKHGVANYIGGNVLIEMALAFYLSKPIYILNDIPEQSTFMEEIIAMAPIVLHGNNQVLLDNLAKSVIHLDDMQGANE